MKAVCWHGTHDVRVDNVSDPELINPRDAIIRVTSTAICGSDLHLYNGVIPTMKSGDVLGHEFMGEVVDTGTGVDKNKLKKGDRVVVPFTIACGHCFFCESQLWSLCDNSNPNFSMADKMYGSGGSGLFGYSHLYGGYSGGQAELVRVPFADVGPFKIPNVIEDDKVLFFTDIFPTGYMAAENCNIQSGDTVAVWGCGPVGQFAIRSAFILGAERVIAIDPKEDRRKLAEEAGAETLPAAEEMTEKLKALTGGRGPDSCIDAVGMEAHGHTVLNTFEKAKMEMHVGTDRPHALRQAIQGCRKGGTVSIPGVYAGLLDKIPFGGAFAKGLTFKMGQTHVHRYLPTLLKLVEEEKIDPSFVITHRLSLSEGAKGYASFKEREDGWIKVVLKP